MNKYKFNFSPNDCNKLYFDELFLLLNMVHPEKEIFKRIPKEEIVKLNIKCSNNFNSCKTDEFFFENKKQIILGRYNDTFGCFFSCKGHYFISAIEPFSVFKNDVFIRYIIDKPELYINNSKKIELEHVFPIRVLLNKNHNIPRYADRKIGSIKEYIFDTIKQIPSVSKDNLEIIMKLPNVSILKKIITENITSRELCMLYYMNLYFYVVEDVDKTLKPFILISKYKLKEIKEIYSKANRPFPKLQYLFDARNYTVKHKFIQ